MISPELDSIADILPPPAPEPVSYAMLWLAVALLTLGIFTWWYARSRPTYRIWQIQRQQQLGNIDTRQAALELKQLFHQPDTQIKQQLDKACFARQPLDNDDFRQLLDNIKQQL